MLVVRTPAIVEDAIGALQVAFQIKPRIEVLPLDRDDAAVMSRSGDPWILAKPKSIV